MADLEAGKLNLENFKLISQMVSNSGVTGRVPGYIGNIKKKQKSYFNFLWRCEMPDLCNWCLYVCLCVFVHTSLCVLCVSSQHDVKNNKDEK
jgi:hypothetical protein